MEFSWEYKSCQRDDFSRKESGADYAKFQTWSTKDLVRGPWHKDNRINLYKKAELSEDDHYELNEFLKKRKLFF